MRIAKGSVVTIKQLFFFLILFWSFCMYPGEEQLHLIAH